MSVSFRACGTLQSSSNREKGFLQKMDLFLIALTDSVEEVALVIKFKMWFLSAWHQLNWDVWSHSPGMCGEGGQVGRGTSLPV